MAIYGTLGGQDSTTTGYPSIQPTLDLNFAKTKTLDPRITFYRNSLATYTDDKGIIRTVPENVPRFDHDPTTGESLGLLIEESRTNAVLHSQSLNNSSVWGQYQSTVSQDSTISPSGQTDAYKITLGTSPSGAYQGIIQGINLSSSNYYTFSCFVKAGNQSIIRISESYSFGYSITANLSTKQITSNGGYVVSQGIQEYPNGWFRIYGVWDLRSISATTYTVWDIYLGTNSTTGLYCYAWGPQLEAGSFPTSYIPTTGSTVTRSADVCYIDGTNFSSWFNPVEGTIFASVSNRLTFNYSSIYVFDDGTGSISNQLVDTSNNNGATEQIFARVSSSTTGMIYTPTPITNPKHAFAYKSADFGVAANGVGITLTSTSGVPPGLNNLKLGAYSTGSVYNLNGTMSRFTYYPKRLTNTQLQNLTA